MFMRIVATATMMLASPVLAAPVVGGFGISYLNTGAPPDRLERQMRADNSLITAGATLGPGTANSIRSQSDAWVNKLEIQSTASQGFVYGGGLSFWALNQTVEGQPGQMARISYKFGVDGSFTPGPAGQYLPPQFVPPQNLTFYFLAYKGRAEGLSVQTDQYGTQLLFNSSVGQISFGRAAGSPGYVNTMPAPFAARAPCFGGDTRCTVGGVFDEKYKLSFDVMTGEEYFLVGYLSSDTNGQTSFFNTSRLLSVELDPIFDLNSQDGGVLTRNASGTYGLAIPEPASWAMLIMGFGLVGAMQRRRRPLPA